MTVYASKPEINVREKLKELDKPMGVAGAALMRADTPQEQFNLIGAGRKNLIINGAMQVAQRGTSFNFSGQPVAYTLDRFRLNVYNTGFATPSDGGTVTQVSLSDADSQKIGFSNALRFAPGTQSKLVYASQNIEGMLYETAGKKVTLSFYARVNTGALNLSERARMSQNFGSGGSVEVNFYSDFSDSVITTSWKKITATFDVPSVVGKTFGPSPYLTSRLFHSQDFSSLAGGRYVEFTGMQLELGSVATPFEHRSYGEELALCQRYFEVCHKGGNLILSSKAGTSFSTDSYATYTFHVEKRATPSVTATYVGGSGTNTIPSTTNVRFNAIASSTCYIESSFTADAEL